MVRALGELLIVTRPDLDVHEVDQLDERVRRRRDLGPVGRVEVGSSVPGATDLNTQTVPMLIYSSGRTAPNPALNAIATLMLVISLAAIGLGFGGMRALGRRLGVQAESSDVAGFRI